MSHESMSYRPMVTTNEELNDEKSWSMADRLTPIGGPSSDTEYGKRSVRFSRILSPVNLADALSNYFSAEEEFHERDVLLEEHEQLTTSLAALTRHFAHVQLRLQQVVSAPTPEDREVKQANSSI